MGGGVGGFAVDHHLNYHCTVLLSLIIMYKIVFLLHTLVLKMLTQIPGTDPKLGHHVFNNLYYV